MSEAEESSSRTRLERWHLLVRGRVQGVYFRASTQEVGEALGLSGWVRNLRDGRVEALVTYCQRGPSLARVDEVQIEKQPARGDLGPGFQVTR